MLPPTIMKKLLLPILLAAGSLFALAQDPKPAAPAAPAAPAGDAVELTLGVIPNTMKYDKAELSVKAGAKVKLTFKNEKCALMQKPNWRYGPIAHFPSDRSRCSKGILRWM